MDWLLVALVAPLLFSISTYLDKYLLNVLFKGSYRVAILYSCLIGFVVLPFALFFSPNILSISWLTAALLIFNGFVYISYLFPYFMALRSQDASSVQTVFQVIPVFGAILAFLLLGESLTPMQALASAIIIFGAVGVSMRFSGKKFGIKKKPLVLLLLAAFLIALNSTLFKVFALDTDFWTTLFYQSLGFGLFGVLLLVFGKNYYSDFVSSLKKNSFAGFSINLFNEIINIVAVLIAAYAVLLAPVALVRVVFGISPLFALLLGIIITIFIPQVAKEDISKKTIAIKLFFVAVTLVGLYFLGTSGV